MQNALKAKVIAVLGGAVLIAARLLIERFYSEQVVSNIMKRTGIDPLLFYAHFFVPGVFWIVCACGAAAFAIWLRGWRTTENARQPWRMVTVVALFTAAMAIAVLISFTQSGFAPIGVLLERPAKALPCAFQRILWTGEKAIVLRCHALGEVRVLHNTQDVVIRSQFPSAPQPHVKLAPPPPISFAAEEHNERLQFQVAWLRHREELRKAEELRQLNAKRREWRSQEQTKLNQRFGTAIDIVDRYPQGMDQALFEEVRREAQTQEAARSDK